MGRRGLVTRVLDEGGERTVVEGLAGREPHRHRKRDAVAHADVVEADLQRLAGVQRLGRHDITVGHRDGVGAAHRVVVAARGVVARRRAAVVDHAVSLGGRDVVEDQRARVVGGASCHEALVRVDELQLGAGLGAGDRHLADARGGGERGGSRHPRCRGRGRRRGAFERVVGAPRSEDRDGEEGDGPHRGGSTARRPGCDRRHQCAPRVSRPARSVRCVRRHGGEGYRR